MRIDFGALLLLISRHSSFWLLPLTVSCLLTIGCVGTVDEVGPPAPPFTNRSWGPTATTAPATALHLGSFTVKLETTTLAVISKEAGGGDIRHQQASSGSQYWLCYTIGDTDLLWIAADDELGGAEHRVTTVTGERLANVRSSAMCPPLPQRLMPVSLDRGFWLGTAEAEARRLLGPESHAEGSWRSYDFQTKVPGACEPAGFDLNNWLWYGSEGGVVTTIWANQITTC